MRLGENSFDSIWNSDYLKAVRRKMVRNQPVGACFKCYHLEATGAKSLRLWSNECALDLSSRGSLQEVYRQAADIVEHHGGQAPLPVSMQLWLDNRCNLACRMCNGHFSSRIASDLVQSRWNPTAASASYITSLFPAETDLEKRWEFRNLFQTKRKRRFAVLKKKGKTISVLATPFPVSEVYICGELSGRGPNELEISLDGKSVLLDVIRERHWSRRISVYHRAINSQVAVTIRVRPPGNKLRISHVALQMSAPIEQAEPESLDLWANLPAGGSSRGWSLSQLIPSPERMREICLAGGEPMMNPETLRLLQHLEQGGELDSTGIFMHTNGTIFNPRIVELLKKFGWVALAFSIDGLGSLFEYIRYPANWKRTWNCILEHRAAGLHVEIQPCIQAYNVFGTVELLRFCDQQRIPYSLNNLLRQPRFLSLDMLPAVVLGMGAVLRERVS
jgi:Radical SAM superfamily